MATYLRSEKCRIQFDDGRKGIQRTNVFDDGTTELSEIVVTVDKDGTRTEEVYGPKEHLDARVYSFSRLGPAKWHVVPGTVTVQ